MERIGDWVAWLLLDPHGNLVLAIAWVIACLLVLALLRGATRPARTIVVPPLEGAAEDDDRRYGMRVIAETPPARAKGARVPAITTLSPMPPEQLAPRVAGGQRFAESTDSAKAVDERELFGGRE